MMGNRTRARIRKFKRLLLTPKGLAALVLIMFVANLLLAILQNMQRATAAVTINTSTNSGATSFSSTRKTFFDSPNDLFWAFYYNGTSVEYSNSPDGNTWTSRGTVAIAPINFSIWYTEGTASVYLITYAEADTQVQKGTLSATSISWSSSTQIFTLGGSEGVVAISRDTNGKLWAAIADDSSGDLLVKESTNADDTSAWGTQQVVDTAPNGREDYNPIILPLTTSGDMYFIWTERPTNGASYLIEGRLWDDSANNFATTATIYSSATGDDNYYSQFAAAVAGENDEVYLLYIDHSVVGVSGQVEFAKYSGGSWGAPIILDSDTGNEEVTITKDPSSGALYAFWQRAGTIYYKKGVSSYDSGNWDTNATTLYSTGTNSFISAGYQSGDYKVFLVWTNGTASPWNVYFETISLNEPPAQAGLATPTSGQTGVNLTPSFTFSTTDSDNDYLRYRLYLYQSNCLTGVGSSPFMQPDGLPQTGWAGQDSQSSTAYASSTTATYTYQGVLEPGTTYCWKVEARDPGGTNFYGAMSNTRLFITAFIPSTPTLTNPVNSQTGLSLLPQLRLYATDTDGDYLRYKIEICSTSNCSAIVRTIDQTSSQTGWLSQSVQNATAYSSGQTAIYNYQPAALTVNTQYWWRAYAIDPGGSNTWSTASGISTFTTATTTTPGQINIGGGTTIYGGTTLGE